MDLRRRQWSISPIFLAATVVTLLFELQLSSAAATENVVFEVRSKFGGKIEKDLRALKAHDAHRHSRLLSSAIDLPLGGDSWPTGQYFAKIGLGTPSRDFHVQVDTGSDLLWVNCAGCIKCPRKSDLVKLTPYDSDVSSTAQTVSCDDSFCSYVYQTSKCHSGSSCKYDIKYGDESWTSGYLVRDVMRLDLVIGNHRQTGSTSTNGTVRPTLLNSQRLPPRHLHLNFLCSSSCVRKLDGTYQYLAHRNQACPQACKKENVLQTPLKTSKNHPSKVCPSNAPITPNDPSHQNAVLNFRLVPASLKQSRQKLLRNKRSLSETILLGKPCRRTISSTNFHTQFFVRTDVSMSTRPWSFTFETNLCPPHRIQLGIGMFLAWSLRSLTLTRIVLKRQDTYSVIDPVCFKANNLVSGSSSIDSENLINNLCLKSFQLRKPPRRLTQPYHFFNAPCKHNGTKSIFASSLNVYTLRYELNKYSHNEYKFNPSISWRSRALDSYLSNSAVDGVMGFGKSNSSFISQLASQRKVKKCFAHCLDNKNGGGIFAIGEVVSPKVKTTPMLSKSDYYSVSLTSVEVGNSVLQLSSGEEVIVDSGTTLAYLPNSVYMPLMNEIFSTHPELTFHNVQDLQGSFICFRYTDDKLDLFPPVTFQFDKSASLTVYPQDYLLQLQRDAWCFGWQISGLQMKDGRELLILGDMALSNKLVVYDIENQVMGWTNHNCSGGIQVKDEQSGSIYTVGAHNLSWSSSLAITKLLTLVSLLVHFLFYH
ncbi:unnamed protein product [Brassica rapa subsp. narinosa]